jgi:hypothetical protein
MLTLIEDELSFAKMLKKAVSDDSIIKEFQMGNLYVSDGKISGGTRGAKVSGILVIIFINLFYFMAYEYLPVGLKVVHLFLSLANIPIAIIGQKIGKAIYEAVHGTADKDTESIYVSRSFKDILMRKYLGALFACSLFELIMFLIFNRIFPYDPY